MVAGTDLPQRDGAVVLLRESCDRFFEPERLLPGTACVPKPAFVDPGQRPGRDGSVPDDEVPTIPERGSCSLSGLGALHRKQPVEPFTIHCPHPS